MKQLLLKYVSPCWVGEYNVSSYKWTSFENVYSGVYLQRKEWKLLKSKWLYFLGEVLEYMYY